MLQQYCDLFDNDDDEEASIKVLIILEVLVLSYCQPSSVVQSPSSD